LALPSGRPSHETRPVLLHGESILEGLAAHGRHEPAQSCCRERQRQAASVPKRVGLEIGESIRKSLAAVLVLSIPSSCMDNTCQHHGSGPAGGATSRLRFLLLQGSTGVFLKSVKLGGGVTSQEHEKTALGGTPCHRISISRHTPMRCTIAPTICSGTSVCPKSFAPSQKTVPFLASLTPSDGRLSSPSAPWIPVHLALTAAQHGQGHGSTASICSMPLLRLPLFGRP